MMYKTELHLHTSDVSTCANAPLSYVVARYLKEGYTTLVVTNHLSRFSFTPEHQTWTQKIDHFLTGYTRLAAEAGQQLTVLLGAELRLNTDENDYLLYGIDEAFLRHHPDLMDYTIKDLSRLCREEQVLLIQAHPFRDHMQIVNPKLLDGIEIYNGMTNPPARNDMAEAWAARFSMIGTSGSDFHDAENEVNGGILTAFPVRSNEMLYGILKSRNFALIRKGDSPY